MGTSGGASPLHEARGGPDVGHHQLRAWPRFLRKHFWSLAIWEFGLMFSSVNYLSRDLKETSRLKSGFIHATRGG